MPEPSIKTEPTTTPVERKLVLTEDEVDVIDALRAARSGAKGKPLEQVLREHGYSLEDKDSSGR